MKLYHESIKLGEASNISFYTALEAFYFMGFELVKVENIEEVHIEEDGVCLGSIQFVNSALKKLNKVVPLPIDYPESLRVYLGRKIWQSTIDEIANDPTQWNVFAKPNGFAKKFTGRLIKSTKDLIGCGDRNLNTPVWVSEPVNFVAEWRVFVRYQRVLGARLYRGDWRVQFDYKVIERAISDFVDAPAGYALDFGLTNDGKQLLIEVNDGYSLGSYGLYYVDYAKLLSARWAQLTGQKDLCYF